MQATNGSGEGGAAGAQSPLDLVHPVNLSRFDLLSIGEGLLAGGIADEAIIELAFHTGSGNAATGKLMLDAMTDEQLTPLIAEAKAKRNARVEREMTRHRQLALPLPDPWQEAQQRYLNSFDTAHRQERLAPEAITAAEVANPEQLAATLQRLATDNRNAHAAVGALAEAALGQNRAVAPLLRNVTNHQGQLHGLAQQVQTNTNDMGQFREYMRDDDNYLRSRGNVQPIVQLLSSDGGAPPDDSSGGALLNPESDQPMEDTGAPPAGGSGGDMLAGLSLFDKDSKPEVPLPPGFSWFWNNSQWLTFQEPSMLNPAGNMRTYPERLAEWETVAPNLRSSGKVRMPVPQHFTGEGEVDPELWLMTAEAYLSTTGLSRAEWGKHAQTLLRGKAQTAYGAIAVPLYNSTKQSLTWDQVRHIVLNYKKKDKPIEARRKLAAIRQEGSVVDYTHYFTQLLAQVGPDPPARTDLLTYYVAGLKDPCELGPAGKQWETLEEVQNFHVQRELEGLKIRAPSNTRHNHLPPRSYSFKNSGRKPSRLNAITQRYGSERSDRSDSSRGRRGGRGGRGGGRGDSGPKKPRLPDSAFGTDWFDLIRDKNGPCPWHPNNHTKGECHAYKRIEQSMAAAEAEKRKK
jgi:hypothetical protein